MKNAHLNYVLCKNPGTTVRDYINMEKSEKTEDIANFVYKRYLERHILPFDESNENRHSFSIMSNCCLLIESLESFYQGWPDTNGRITNSDGKR